jgi:hypothetical protein
MFRLASKFKILIFYGQFYDFFRWKKAAKKEIIKNYNSQITAPGPTQPEQAPKKVWPWPIIEMPGGTASSARGSNLASVFLAYSSLFRHVYIT